MAKGPRYNVPFRRRREGKTDYRLRRRLVQSGLPRLVVRGSLKNIVVQVVEADIVGDRVVVSAHSRELVRDYGWRGPCGNIPAAYLTGQLCGYKALTKGVKEAVLDIGLHAPTKGARVFAALKGFLDAGVMVRHGEEILPDEDRIRGQHIAEYAAQLSAEDKEAYVRMFSQYLANGLPPEELPKHFLQIKEKISERFKVEK
ncbi:MAG: 50S ribosomal protein L18 [Candidatus Bathyarchaeota archaeon B26-2]|nr:MAG: 50S ribosomal protein L18 [Candidatus Bathyarchaeota archaeon B26-2]